MKRTKVVLLVFSILLCSNLVLAITINVPGDQPTIQAGINVAVDSDTVLVQPGTYVENINYNGKNITVASLFYTTQDTSYISQTIIDGSEIDRVVKIEESNFEICGFTIRNGYIEGKGGGIQIINGNNKIKNCVFICKETLLKCDLDLTGKEDHFKKKYHDRNEHTCYCR